MFKRNKNSAGLPGESASNSYPNQNQILAVLAQDYMHDKKIRRRWRIVLIGVIISYFVIAAFLMLRPMGSSSVVSFSHTALVELDGAIGVPSGVSSQQINASLRKAFEAPSSIGVVLKINSPGGTPVQASEISDEITRLKAQFPDKPIHTVVSDVCASGGYFIAAATDNIYVNRSSIVGSIGVRMDSFGFVDAMKKLGVERRSITAGENKAILDPFLPVKPSERAHAEKMLAQVHQHFIDVVKEGRGERLSDNPDIFSGLFWTGEEAKTLGLVDELGSVGSVARDVLGADKVVNYTQMPSFFERVSRDFGVAVGKGIGSIFMQQNWTMN
jgi:protease-4